MAGTARDAVRGLAIAGVLATAAPQLLMRAQSLGDIHSVTSPRISPAQTALVLGARVWEDGRPSLFLRQRVETAVTLYHSGLVDRLLVSGSGDNREGLDETVAMRDTAIDLGVPLADIDVDRDGVNTAASCLRAHHVFGLASVTVVSQEFHLPRALWWCRRAGMVAQGVHPHLMLRPHTALGYGRELAASWKAVVDVSS